MDDAFDDLKNMKEYSLILREVGQDMINVSNKMDSYFKQASDPMQIIFNSNLSDELTKKANEIHISVLMITNKMNALNEYAQGLIDKKEGD